MTAKCFFFQRGATEYIDGIYNCHRMKSSVTLFILEFVRSVVMNDFTERTDSLISVVNN